MRLKVTEYDNKIKGVLYSNERVVTKGGSVGDDPITPAIDVTEDPNHEGKYVFQINVNSDAQEYLVVPDDRQISASRRISFLDWSGATTSKVIDNLDYGAYIVYTRYAATATTEAGKKVAYSNAFAKVVLATEDVQISYITRANAMIPTRNQPVLSSGDDFATYVNGGVRYFIVESLPYGANDEVAKSTHWWCADETILQPMKIQRDRVNGDSWVEIEWGNITGNTFAFKGIKAGTVDLHAETTLLNGTVKDTVIHVQVMPDAATPYKMTTTAEGETVKLMPGQTYEPQLVVSPDTVQPDSSKLRWMRKNSTSTTPGVVVNTNTGVVTIMDDAQIGEIATIRGQYTRGSGMTPLSFEYKVEVIASDQISAHAHPGEDHTFTTFQQYDENQHLQICACGETAYAAHEFQDEVIKQATNEATGILRHVCKDCGYSYEETIPVGVHVHELYWDYDESEHWQSCEAEECPEENYEINRGTHDLTSVGTTDDGLEIYACSVCGMIHLAAKPHATISYATASFEGQIELNFYLGLPDWVVADAGSKVVFTRNGIETPVLVSEAEYDPEDDVYCFTYPVVAKAFRDNVNLKVYDGKGQLVTLKNKKGTNDYTESGVNYSAETYANKMLAKEDTDQAMKDLAQALLDYGAAAQIYFTYGDYSSLTVPDYIKAITLDDLEKYAAKFENSLPAGITGRSISVVFESDNTFKLYFTFAEGVDPLKKDAVTGEYPYQFLIDGNPATLRSEDGEYWLEIANTPAKKLGKNHEFTVTDGETTYKVICSALAYARSSVKNGTEARKDLGKALYLYYLAARAKFGEKGILSQISGKM